MSVKAPSGKQFKYLQTLLSTDKSCSIYEQCSEPILTLKDKSNLAPNLDSVQTSCYKALE